LGEDLSVTEQRTPLEQALDMLVYLPVGLALTAREEVPRIIEKGRQRVGNEVQMARMIGQFAVNQGQREASKVVRQATDVLTGLATRPVPPVPGGGDRPPAPAPPAAPRPSSNGAAAAPSMSADGLAIPGYDALSASQVVQRLGGLSPAELEAVRAYEEATRGRRTILTKVAQLQGGASACAG
jgi:hypothetical protein